MSENNSQLNELWLQLSTTMEAMFQLQSLTEKVYMDLFKSVFTFLMKYCNKIYFSRVGNYFSSTEYNDNFLIEAGNKPKPTNTTNQPTNETKKPTDEKENEPIDDITIPGSALYFRLKNFLRNYLVGIAEVSRFKLRNIPLLNFIL
jgi:hypothetical protein